MLDQLMAIDRSFFHLINSDLSNSFLDVILPFFRKSSNWYLLYIFLLYLAYRKKGIRFSILMLVLGGITIFFSDYMVANHIKHWVERVRPCNNPEMTVVLVIEKCGSGFSFVSAHACNHFALAVLFKIILDLYQNKLYIIGLLWAAIISFAQVYVGVHYPSDVLCGAILGMGCGWLVVQFIYPYLSKRLNI